MHFRTAFSIYLIQIILFTAFTGCGNPGTPSLPDTPGTQITNNTSQTHTCLGLWQFHIDPATESIDYIPLRTSEIHMNGLAFMEPPVGVALAIDQIVDFSSSVVTVDIKITHPYAGMDFATAFDVSGILISHGSLLFPFSDSLYFPGEDNVRLLNPDGFTRWWNPVEFPENAAKPHMGYIDGLLGKEHSEVDFNAILNGYKYFASDLSDPEASLSELDKSMRGAFIPGTSCTRRYQIGFTPGSLVFNYAVDANWAPADGGPPIVIPDDFPFSANRPEAYRIELQNVNNTLTWDPDLEIAEGAVAMSVYVYDWHNAGENMCCAFAQDDKLMGFCVPEPVDYGDGWAVFNMDMFPMMMDSGDDILAWFGIECEEYDYQGALPFEIQGVYFQEWFTVEEK